MINNAISIIPVADKAWADDPLQGHLPPPLTDQSVWNCLLPLYHVFGFVGCSTLSAYLKSEIVFAHPGFSSDAALNATEARGTTIMCGTPTMIIDILNNDDLSDYDVSSLR